MSRTRRIYNRQPWVYFWQWSGSSYKASKIMWYDADWSWVFWKQICMGHCKSCKRANYDKKIVANLVRNAMEPLTMWGL